MSILELKAKFRAGALSKSEFIRQCLISHRTLFEYADIIGPTDVREIHIDGEGVSFILGEEGLRLYCPPDEARVAPLEVINFDQYEPNEMRIIDMLSADAHHILDIGANIGLYSVRFARRMVSAQIWAFEPVPKSHAYLQRNIAANDVGARVTALNYGLSDKSGSVDFFISPTSCTNASLVNVAHENDADRVVGLVLTLDQWAGNWGVSPDFIKCDVEGAELLVFRGARKTLIKDKPVVFSELLRKWTKPFGYHPNDVIRLFADLGYSCFAVGENGVQRLREVTEETLETNYAFIHAEAHAHLMEILENTSE